MPHADWPKTLEWIEKQAQESMRARFATADLIAKEAQTTLAVLLAGIGGSAAYGAKVFNAGPAGPLEIASAWACGYLIVAAAVLVLKCMMFRSYPALFQDPANLMHPDRALDEIREAELEKIGERITEAATLNRERAALLNRCRLAAVASPLVFAAVAAWAVSRQQAPTGADKTKIACVVAEAASGVGGTVTCEVGK